jgi:1-acyl-sn-glycerol-3-phosphate acyltransferase
LIDTDVLPRKSGWLTSPVSAEIISINQQISYWISKVIGFALGMTRNIEVKPQNLDRKFVYLIAANHQCRMDPFVITGAMPWSTWRRLSAFRYMVYKPLFDIPLLGQFMLGLGCFPATEHPKHPFGLDYSRIQIAQGRNIFIFPEGRRVIRGERTARRGVAELAKEPKVRVLPAHIEWRRRGWWHGFDVAIGEPFDGSKMTAQEILDHVYSIPVRQKR